ncbi:MAG: hypothetical protein K2W78_12765 [Xanthobacteraceae bacterium]|nr:hypothetical protein [Xanthobacteraceae bacterium]
MTKDFFENDDILFAFSAGAQEERERIRTIMAMPEVAGREGAALQLALHGTVPVECIREILRLAPPSGRPAHNVRLARRPSQFRIVRGGK